MNIQGLQKLTLLDYPGKVACTIFTGGCNFLCPFCHNSDLVIGDSAHPDVTGEEVLAFLDRRAKLLDGVCLTGGEPLLNDDLADFLQKVRALGYQIKLDTNGSRPEQLKKLVTEGLVDYVAMDIKNAPNKYALTIGVPEYDLRPVRESVEFLLSGAVDYEFRTTVVREFHQAVDFVIIGQWIKGARRYYLQGFVDSEAVPVRGLHGVPAAAMREFQGILQPLVPATELRGIDI